MSAPNDDLKIIATIATATNYEEEWKDDMKFFDFIIKKATIDSRTTRCLFYKQKASNNMWKELWKFLYFFEKHVREATIGSEIKLVPGLSMLFEMNENDERFSLKITTSLDEFPILQVHSSAYVRFKMSQKYNGLALSELRSVDNLFSGAKIVPWLDLYIKSKGVFIGVFHQANEIKALESYYAQVLNNSNVLCEGSIQNNGTITHKISSSRISALDDNGVVPQNTDICAGRFEFCDDHSDTSLEYSIGNVQWERTRSPARSSHPSPQLVEQCNQILGVTALTKPGYSTPTRNTPIANSPQYSSKRLFHPPSPNGDAALAALLHTSLPGTMFGSSNSPKQQQRRAIADMVSNGFNMFASSSREDSKKKKRKTSPVRHHEDESDEDISGNNKFMNCSDVEDEEDEPTEDLAFIDEDEEDEKRYSPVKRRPQKEKPTAKNYKGPVQRLIFEEEEEEKPKKKKRLKKNTSALTLSPAPVNQPRMMIDEDDEEEFNFD